MTSLEEKNLIKKLKKSDDEAYAHLLDSYGNRLLKTCYLILKDSRDAEDVVQETFIRVFKNIHTFKGKPSLYTWIYRIGMNICKDKMRKKLDYETLYDIHEDSERVEDIVFSTIDRAILREELFKLNPHYREVLVLFYFEDNSIKEIGEVLDIKEGTVKSRLNRGRNILRDELMKGGHYE